jgi:hypothetical protein
VLGAAFIVACLLFGPGSGSAQTPGTSPGGRNGFGLEQNYPNPFNPETTIPFTLGEELFAAGVAVQVSMRIFNLLGQPVASVAHRLRWPNLTRTCGSRDGRS